MPEYVYALHDFNPENEDEVPFRAGDRIEVVEKDDLYGDGWWQGKNLEGRVGLFPCTYTTPILPDSTSHKGATSSMARTSALHTLSEESETASTAGGAMEASEGVMKATMTDVQKAIEQLGRRTGRETELDGDGFSFASTQPTTDDEHAEGEDWHKRARRKLAEVVSKGGLEPEVDPEEQLERERQKEIERRLKPPIQAELSDESEAEDNDQHERHPQDLQKPLNGPSTVDGTIDMVSPGNSSAGGSRSAPAPLAADHQDVGNTMLTVKQESYIDFSSPSSDTFAALLPGATEPNVAIRPRQSVNGTTSERTSLPTFISAGASKTPSTSATVSIAEKPPTEVFSGNMTVVKHSLPSPQTSKHSSLSSVPMAAASTTADTDAKKPASHPTDWTVEEVVDWLKSKGFDQDVCDKFSEQEITGDVLLELDVNLLKSEIGIVAFGKRMRIANAIIDLRRPPSVMYMEGHPPPGKTNQYNSPAANMHSHSHSQSYTYSHPVSVAGSAQGTSPGPSAFNGAPRSAGIAQGGADSPQTSSAMSVAEEGLPIGLGLASVFPSTSRTGKPNQHRPAQLSISPSESNLASIDIPRQTVDPAEEDEERAIMSESEAVPSSGNARRRFWERSDSSPRQNKNKSPSPRQSKNKSPSARSSREVKSGSPVARRDSTENDKRASGGSTGAPTVGTRRLRSQRLIDVAKTSDRLSLFGGVLMPGSLGKARKPPPRYSSADPDAPNGEKEKPNPLLSRFYSGNQSRRSNSKSTVDLPSKAPEDAESATRSPTSTHRRTRSEDEPPNATELQPGESVLQQIGIPDHAGWMRKKGERYNTWRYRYFVLKGAHLYCLRNDTDSEKKLKGYIYLSGYKVIVDENLDPGRYGFKIVHDSEKPHYFSSDEQGVIRDWMKAIMKTSIERDYSRVVVSSCNIPTIPLVVAQTMNPSPRPPSPTARAATQKALRRENPNKLSPRDARILMGLPPPDYNTIVVNPSDSTSSTGTPSTTGPPTPKPPRPPRERMPTQYLPELLIHQDTAFLDIDLVQWANSRLPPSLQFSDVTKCTGLMLLRLAELIAGRLSFPAVADSAFPTSPTDDKLDGLFRLFDFLLDNEVKMGSVSINDVRQGKREKIVQLLMALKAWEDKKQMIAQTLAQTPSSPNGLLDPIANKTLA